MTRDGRYVLRPGEYERTKKRGFEYKYRDEFGHQHTLGAMTLQELREKEKTIVKDKIDGVRTSVQQDTLNRYYQLWKAGVSTLKSTTYSNYIWMYETFLSQNLGKMKVKDIKESDIATFYKDLLKRGLAVSTLDSIQTVLHQVLNVAFKDDVIRRNPSDEALKKIKRANPPEKKKALTPEELVRFRSVIAGSVWYPVFEVMSWTGMRVGEVTGLTWDDIDRKEGVIHVRRTLTYYKDAEDGHMVRAINSTKTPASFRDLPLNDHILKALDFQKENCPECTEVVDGMSGFIFGTRFHGCQHQGVLNKALRRIIKDANAEKTADVLIPYFSCHTLRRTYATNLCRAGVNIAVVMKLMGHNDVETTLSVYTDVQHDMTARGDAQLQAWLRGESTATNDVEKAEYDDLRSMAEKIVLTTKEARDQMQRYDGTIRAGTVKKLADLGISYDDL